MNARIALVALGTLVAVNARAQEVTPVARVTEEVQDAKVPGNAAMSDPCKPEEPVKPKRGGWGIPRPKDLSNLAKTVVGKTRDNTNCIMSGSMSNVGVAVDTLGAVGAQVLSDKSDGLTGVVTGVPLPGLKPSVLGSLTKTLLGDKKEPVVPQAAGSGTGGKGDNGTTDER